MKWITLTTTKSSIITVKEEDVARIVIDPATGTGTVTFNNSCYTYDIIDNGINKYLCEMSIARPLPDCDPELLRQEVQDLKLENDRLAKRDDKMRQVIRAIACDPDCEFCLLRGSDCSGSDMQALATKTLKELEDL